MNSQELRKFRETLRKFERIVTESMKEKCSCQGVSLSQCHVLLEIEILGETTVGELSRRIGLDQSTLSRTIHGLVTSGQIQRSPHPKDRRVTLLSLTEMGRRTCNDLNRINDDYIRKAFSTIPENSHHAIFRTFEVLVNALLMQETSPPEIFKASEKGKGSPKN